MLARNSRLLFACSLASVCGVLVGACKPLAPRVPRGGDLESYLAALESNESELRSAGVVVARAEPLDVSPVAAAPRDEVQADEVDPDDDALAEASEAEAEAESEERVFATQSAPPAEAPERARKVAAKRERRSDARDRCERICDLAEMACELEARICELAQEHQGEARYADACDRAQQQCEMAAEACRTCA